MPRQPSNKATSWKRFPIGELAEKRKQLKDSYLVSNAENTRLQNELKDVQKDVNKTSKRVERLKERLSLASYDEQSLTAKRRKLEEQTCVSSKRKQTIRQKTPSQLYQNNSEKLSSDISVRSAQRRRKETMAACRNIHGDTEDSATDGMWVTLVNECSKKKLQSCFETSSKIQEKVIPAITKTQVKKYEESQDNMNTFGHDSSYWSDKKTYQVQEGLEGLTEKESKLASYWNTPFSKICLGMNVNNGATKWIKLDYEASSLYSVIAGGVFQATTAGRNTWKTLIDGSSLQLHCDREGFNNYEYYSKVIFVSARLGIIANNEDNCATCDSWIGFGVSFSGCGIVSAITNGNLAICSDTDNGHKTTAAFGYLLVQ